MEKETTNFFIQLFTYNGETMDNTHKTDDEKRLKDGEVVAVLLPMSDVDHTHVYRYAITKNETIIVVERHLIKGEKVMLTYPQKSDLSYAQSNSERTELAKTYLKGMAQQIRAGIF